MSEAPVDPTGPEPTPRPKPQRVLIPSPIGVLGVELTGSVLTRVVITPIGRQRKKFKPFADLKRNERTEQMDEVLGRFSEYFAGARRNLDLGYDLTATGLDAFGRRVLKQTAKIPFGRTRTYQQVAEAAGRPTAYRQVLAILIGNPLPLVVPCHRVVTNRSGIGSFIAGPKKKAWLLKMEQKTREREPI